ncbi:PaaI family thioesterase [Laribacter hongkongensis]|uniref:PaaI family thioesterase n=1 Tax=Laribacter hongkongensis TaxID=168471 RepID=A0ABD4SRW0_9NEIS|nr:PaaI family thioesterase [Laribacter hongkongensis]MCG9025334.1 PaaI family thioesterase [Laribacter hongkongensis]MCG9099797.1 PaaI family thioesterase [Laribacter hongkongensis]MCG9103401.1 PaaI family thioesterase [Laribacter hongkongensis]MCG9111275.1 PaaI family thioesterase [Laribacter hongkongensis]MCG9118569.1 PaaI family thioesterase [Laribacter hongkongensis]
MSEYVTCFQALREARDYAGIVDSIPYARLLGVQFVEESEGRLLFSLPFAERNIGNPLLPAMHGGVLGGFMENAALVQLLWVQESRETPKTVDFSLDYLRSAKPHILFARCEFTKQGKRVANMQVTAWQEDESRPVAVARGHFLLN